MRIVSVTVAPDPPPGMICIHYTTPRGDNLQAALYYPAGYVAGRRYLDLGGYAEADGVPFTFSSNLLHALHAADVGLADHPRAEGVA